MEQRIELKYINERLQIGMVDRKQVYLLHPKVTPLLVEVDKGRLVYRAKGSNRRISYAQIKKELIKKSKWIVEEVPSWLPDIK